MGKPWQQKIVEQEKAMSNEELLDEVLFQAGGDDYDGCFTANGKWEYDFLEECLRIRLKDWLKEDKNVV